jgi:proteasome lid subunit RPN8/RPN11
MDEILFGEVEETPPQPELRPDRNRHYAVAAWGAPGEKELPIYVDLDVMRDMEAHAQTDTSVELGGVMLGGQYHDEQGRPFVVVTDSLRASHYEATKGSFKFTHDTWQKISRERDQFPADLQMVGWYHTHPDWGVFLSGMDMFICDNFFNKPLDVALVIDPCRGDRGWFQWTGDSRQRIRRTGGFYLIASRFRQQELELYAAQLEGKLAMPTDSRYSGIAPPPGTYGAPIVNVSSDRGNSWQAVAMFGLLSVQFLFLMLMAWRLLLPGGMDAAKEKEKTELAAVQESLDALRAEQRAAAKTEAQLAVMGRVLANLKETPEDFVKSLEEQQFENDQLRATVRAQMAEERELSKKNEVLARSLESAKTLAERRKDVLDAEIASHKKKTEKKDEQIALLTKKLEAYEPPKKDEEDEEDGGWFSGWNLVWISVSAGVIVLLAAGGAAAAFYRPREEREEEEPADAPTGGIDRAMRELKDPPPPANKE